MSNLDMSKLNKYPGAKRLMLEAQELRDNTEDYCAQPVDDNLFEWHFTLRGPPDTAFEGGFYHGRLSFPTEYPMKPPSIMLLTPNGRFQTNRKICLSISAYHPETWQPSWSVRTALLALIAFMPSKAKGAIGALDFSDAERRRLAIKSRSWCCENCGLIKDLLIDINRITQANPSPESTCLASKDNCKKGKNTLAASSDSSSLNFLSDNETCQISNSGSTNQLDNSETEIGDNSDESQNSMDCNNANQNALVRRLESTSSSTQDDEENDGRLHEQEKTTKSNQDNLSIDAQSSQQLVNGRRSSSAVLILGFILISLVIRRLLMVVQL